MGVETIYQTPVEPGIIPDRSYTVDEAFDYCARVTNSHYENFPVASLFLPAGKRPYIQAVYAFSRAADDFADEGSLPPETRLARLGWWESMLEDCYKGTATHPVFLALRETIERLNLPIEPFRELLTAFKWDVTKNRYETLDELLAYCRCSANPVGRLILMIFNYRGDRYFLPSDAICTALQLANFWQDISIDAAKDRLYIPLQSMREKGYSIDDWKSATTNRSFAVTMKPLIERTRSLFYEGAGLPSDVDRDLSIELRMIWFGGMAILSKTERALPTLRSARPSLTGMDKFLVLSRAFRYSDVSTYGKPKELWDLT